MTVIGKLYELSAKEIESAKKWIEALTRSVWHSRVIHGNKFLSEADAQRFVGFRKRWDKFENKVGPWSLWDRTKEENKKWLDSLLEESRRIYNEYSKKGMTMIYMPGQTELILLARKIPKGPITAKQAKAILSEAVDYGSKVRDENTTWLETFRKVMSFPVKPIWETDREKAFYPLYDALETGLKELLLWHEREPFWRWSEQPKYDPGSPEYKQWRKTIDRIFIESATLIGVHEQIAVATAEAIDVATDQVVDITRYFLYGAGILGSLLLYSYLRKDKVDVNVEGLPRPEPA